MKTFNAGGPWCPGAQQCPGPSGAAPRSDLGLRHFWAQGDRWGTSCWGTYGVWDAQKTRPPSWSHPGAATGAAALGAAKVPGPASPGAAGLSSHPGWRDAVNHLHSRLISNKKESTKSYRNNLSLVNKTATTYWIQIKAQWKYLNM